MKERIKNPLEYSEGTTYRGGRERDLDDYEGWLGFKRENLQGKIVLDLGSGEKEIFSKELENENITAKVFSLNPDYKRDIDRSRVLELPGWQRKSVAGIGQLIPFKDNTFDYIFGLYSVTIFLHNFEASRLTFKEIARVLKPGGQARLAPFNTDELEDYKEIFEELKKDGLSISLEMISTEDLGLKMEMRDTFWSRVIIGKPL